MLALTSILLAICVIALISLIIYIRRPPKKIDKIRSQYKENITELSNYFGKQQQEEISKKTKEIEAEINKIQSVLNEKREDFNKQKTDLELTIKELSANYEEKRNSIEATLQEYSQQEQKKITQKLLDRQQVIEKELHTLEDRYQLTIQDYECKTFDMKCKYEDEVEELNQKIEEKRKEINNLIEQFKKDEELRKENDFYRITISEADKEDIDRLKSIAMQLNNPSILYKLIWKEYYEKSFNAMVGRTLGGNAEAIGIYKITNIKNQMSYIGQTRAGFKSRWRTHAKRAVKAEEGTSNKLYQEMWNEGLENFTFQVIESCNKEKLNEREKFYIEFYNSTDYGYNSRGGNQ